MRVLVLSPHYDDAPLSLGQSLLDGALAAHDVTVAVVFGRAVWTRWYHPSRRRWPLSTAIRRTEELRNARRFGYRLVVGDREEATLRLGTTDTARYLDPTADPAASPELEVVVRRAAGWAEQADAVLAPLGAGDHLDHLIVAAAARRLAGTGVGVGHYADRPYATALADAELAARAAALDPSLTAVAVSGPVTAAKAARLWYPSQFDPVFTDALAADERDGRRELVAGPPDLVGELLGSWSA